MRCPECGHENREGARFCDACGAALEVVATREERKVVTVLFADLVGFTARAEAMDPEDVRALLGPYHMRLREELESYGGTVEKFIGDAVMALFGAPIAHEDDPERAVRAALAIRDWVSEEEQLQVRIAVNTGEALVALGARPEAGEGMASGDVVNTAARLQSSAPVNGVLVGETTYRATRHVIDYEEHEPVEAKGKPEPISVWEALQARSRFGTDVVQASRAPLVGRDHELGVLRDALNRAIREPSVQLVTLIGVPGIGKSRLVYELMQNLPVEPALVTWRQGRCLPYGEGVTFWALGEMVKAQAGVLETDAPDVVAAKLDAAVDEIVTETDAPWVKRHLRVVAGAVGEAESSGTRDEAFAAWLRFLEALAETRPTVLVFEDLHWADDALLEFIEHVVDWATDVPLLVLGTARPELLDRRPNWGGGFRNAQTLSLRALDDVDTAKMVAALLGRSVLPVEAQTSLLERAEGNPLYAEEYVRMYRERASAEDLPLPETVQGIIAARLDALPSAEKELLQTAAVMGKVFWTGALAAVGAVSRAQTEQLLHTLDRKEFVRRERRPSLADEVEYSFRHVLVRDVAYSQIPRATRAKGHLGAAEWIESLGRPRDHAEMLAHHFSTALELERTLGHDSSMLAARTRYALHAAGDRAASVKAFPSAVRYYDDALALTPSGPDRLDLVFARAVAAFWTYSDDRAAVLGDAAKELVDAGDVERAAQVEALLAEVEWLHADHAAMAVHLDRAVHFIRPRPSSEAKARVLSQVARQRMLARDVEGALTFGTEALHLAEELGLDQVKAHVLISVGAARGTHGESDAGIAQIQQGLELAKSHDAYDAIGRAYQNLSAIVWHMDFAQCVAYGLEAERAFQRLGPRAAAYPAASVVANLYWLGEWDEAVSRADRLIERHAAGAELAEQNAREIRAQIRFGRDDEQGASADGERALAIARAATDAQSVIPSHIYAAMIAIRSGRRDEASRHCDVALGEPTRAFLHHATIEFALVLQELGRADEIRDELAAYPVRTLWHDAARAIVDSDLVRGADLLAELGMPTLVAHTRLAAARELSTAGRHREADAQLQAALRLFRSVRATRYVREAEALLAAAS